MTRRQITHVMTPDITSATYIDYTDVDAICGYSLLLRKIFEQAREFDNPTATFRAIKNEGETWLCQVKTLIDNLLTAPDNPRSAFSTTIAAMPDLIAAYDTLYRVCYRHPCNGYLRRIKLKTVDRWLRGDKTITETDVVLLLLSEADRDIRTLEKRYYDYAFSALGKWIDELTRHAGFINTPKAEAYKRLEYLLKDNLVAYLGRTEKQDAAKTAWAKAYHVDDPTTLDTPTLRYYINFSNAASNIRAIPIKEQFEDYIRLTTELNSREDLDKYLHAALTIDISLKTNLLNDLN